MKLSVFFDHVLHAREQTGKPLEELLAVTGDGRENVPWYGQLMNRPQTIAYLVQVNYWMEKYRVELV